MVTIVPDQQVSVGEQRRQQPTDHPNLAQFNSQESHPQSKVNTGIVHDSQENPHTLVSYGYHNIS